MREFISHFCNTVLLNMDSMINLTISDNRTNSSGFDDNNTQIKTHLVLYDVLIPIIGLFVIILNLAVVISSGLILKRGQQPKSTYLFLGNVALTDFFTGIAVVFGLMFPKQYRNHYICAVQMGTIVSSTLTSVLSVGLIAIDRFFYILYGLNYQRWIYPARARLLIALSWIIGCLIGFMPLFGWYGDTKNGKACWFIMLAPKALILLTVITGVIPLLLTIILYSIILYHAIKKIVELQKARANQSTESGILRMSVSTQRAKNEPETNQTSLKNNDLNKWKAIKVVLFTTGSFVVTWTPYFIASSIFVYFCVDNDTKMCHSLRLAIASPLAILGFMNSLINPIIYAWWHKGFRHFVQKRFNTMLKRNNRVQNVSSSGSGSNKTSSTRPSDSNETDRCIETRL